jgi:hypothetical protein
MEWLARSQEERHADQSKPCAQAAGHDANVSSDHAMAHTSIGARADPEPTF